MSISILQIIKNMLTYLTYFEGNMENNDYYNELKRKLKEFRSLRNKVSSDKLAILDYDISTLMDNLKQPRKIKVTLEEVLFREY